MIRYLLGLVPEILDKLNKASTQRVLIYAVFVLNITGLILYKNEISAMMYDTTDERLELISIQEAQNKCYELRVKYSAQSIAIYAYQPYGQNKTHKERMAFSNEAMQSTLPSISRMSLFSRADILADLNKKGYSILTSTSGHLDSHLVTAYGLNKILIAGVYSETGELIGEVMWMFAVNSADVPISIAIQESRIFSYYFNFPNN